MFASRYLIFFSQLMLGLSLNLAVASTAPAQGHEGHEQASTAAKAKRAAPRMPGKPNPVPIKGLVWP